MNFGANTNLAPKQVFSIFRFLGINLPLEAPNVVEQIVCVLFNFGTRVSLEMPQGISFNDEVLS